MSDVKFIGLCAVAIAGLFTVPVLGIVVASMLLLYQIETQVKR